MKYACMALWIGIGAAAFPCWAGDWKPTSIPLTSRWTEEISPDRVWPEYPRPQLMRADWINLNGLWQYAIRPKDQAKPTQWDGEILVPYPVESALSGVGRFVQPDQKLWYRRNFASPTLVDNQRLLLNFGAVDWHAVVYLNGKRIDEHKGGYLPFSFDITDHLAERSNELIVEVWDPTNKSDQPRGKQTLKPRGIFYTPTTGIWQTAWLEKVPCTYIRELKITPDIDHEEVDIVISSNRALFGSTIQAEVKFEGKTIQSVRRQIEGGGLDSVTLRLDVPEAKLWEPDAPHLYDLAIHLTDAEGVSDHITSYFGMRKIEVRKDAAGVNRLFLNGRPVFQYGVLNQGWWPDGLYTAPCDEALRYDIEAIKRLGMNLARKHIKIEHARWYYWADRLGLLVWQDMPAAWPGKTEHARAQFRRELKDMVHTLHNHPSIVMWVVFNEGSGQHNTEAYARLVKQWDPSRLVNAISGWKDEGVGDVRDMHRYPGPGMPELEEKRAVVLGEFGGLQLPVENHLWQQEYFKVYRVLKTRDELMARYEEALMKLEDLAKKGLCAAVYTQITDIEGEVNGLLTYDRKLFKVDIDRAVKAAAWLQPALSDSSNP